MPAEACTGLIETGAQVVGAAASAAAAYFAWRAAVNASESAADSRKVALAAERGAQATRKLLRADAMGSLIDRFGSDEMLRDMRRLRDWEKAHGDRFAVEFERLLAATPISVDEINHARRRVKQYFRKAHLFWKNGLLSNDELHSVVSEGQVVFLLEVLEPLELALNRKNVQAMFDDFADRYRLQARRRPAPA